MKKCVLLLISGQNVDVDTLEDCQGALRELLSFSYTECSLSLSLSLSLFSAQSEPFFYHESYCVRRQYYRVSVSNVIYDSADELPRESSRVRKHVVNLSDF